MYRCYKKIIIFLFFICFLYGGDVKTNEDDKIFKALSLVDVGDYKSAINIYKDLFVSTNKLEYLEESIRLSINIGDVSNALDYIAKYQNIDNRNLKIKYYLANIYTSLKNIDKAILVYEEIVKLEKKESANKINYKLLGSLYATKKDFSTARKCLMQSYEIEKELHTLLLISTVDLSVNKLDEELILDFFKDEIDNDFSIAIIQIAYNNKMLSSIESLFKKYYDKKPNKANANNLFRIAILNDRLDEALVLANKYDLNLELIIDKYIALKDYKNARILLEQLMQKKADNYYYGILAMIDFEDATDKRAVLDNVIKNFKIALKDSTDPVFENYLGYLLIDFDIDIKNGIKYIKNALKDDPQNPAYLDSLAWGYFKLNKCNNALEIINKIPRNVLDNEKEIKNHLESIEQCLKK